MKKIYLIGIGPGNHDYLTLQAINTMKKVDVFFILLTKQGFWVKNRYRAEPS